MTRSTVTPILATAEDALRAVVALHITYERNKELGAGFARAVEMLPAMVYHGGATAADWPAARRNLREVSRLFLAVEQAGVVYEETHGELYRVNPMDDQLGHALEEAERICDRVDPSLESWSGVGVR